jgi:tetraacyldisaccharide 4'-kinase
MRAPDFWWRRVGLRARLLSPVATVYGRMTVARMSEAATAHAPVPVVCVGNLVAGGGGKTPTVAALTAEARASARLSPVILSRGYGGRLEGPLLVDRERHSAADVGDEPLMLAISGETVVVARDRAAGAGFAVGHGADILVMDDGFQNPSLYKDLSVLVVDRERGVGNGLCLPAGPLRAPVESQLERADFLLLTGRGGAADAVIAAAAGRGVAVIAARSEAARGVAALAGRRVLAFAGIANPDKFFESLREAGCEVVEARPFADHHPYSEADCRAISEASAAAGLLPVTTAKDRVRLSGGPERDRLAALCHVHEVRLVAEDARAFGRIIDAARTAFAERGAATPDR